MSPADRQLAARIAADLSSFGARYPLPGVARAADRDTLVAQLVESVRRARYYPFIRSTRTINAARADPHDDLFEPLLAAILHHDAGDIEEASWLVFLSVYFGRNRRTAWRLARDVYGALGRAPWTFARMRRNPAAFRRWLGAHQTALRTGPPRRFGNHRKYESLDAGSPRGTAAAFESYVEWIRRAGGHRQLFGGTLARASGNGRAAFDELFRSMDVASFGRTAKFDYLVMIGKLTIAPLEPGSLYLAGATGPRVGGRLLFGASLPIGTVDARAVELADALGVPVHVVEDALCNWQKSPGNFEPFRG